MTIMVNWVQLKMFSHQSLKFKKTVKSCCARKEVQDVVSFDLNAKNGM
jgi:archaellum biogenesis ATPase FlaH